MLLEIKTEAEFTALWTALAQFVENTREVDD